MSAQRRKFFQAAPTIDGCVSLAIAAAPLVPATLVAGLLASNFAQGIVFATYLNLVLQAAGTGGHCHSSRVTIFDSAGNIPLAFMPALLGLVAAHRGARATALADGVENLIVCLAFLLWLAWRSLRTGRPLPPQLALPEA